MEALGRRKQQFEVPVRAQRRPRAFEQPLVGRTVAAVCRDRVTQRLGLSRNQKQSLPITATVSNALRAKVGCDLHRILRDAGLQPLEASRESHGEARRASRQTEPRFDEPQARREPSEAERRLPSRRVTDRSQSPPFVARVRRSPSRANDNAAFPSPVPRFRRGSETSGEDGGPFEKPPIEDMARRLLGTLPVVRYPNGAHHADQVQRSLYTALLSRNPDLAARLRALTPRPSPADAADWIAEPAGALPVQDDEPVWHFNFEEDADAEEPFPAAIFGSSGGDCDGDGGVAATAARSADADERASSEGDYGGTQPFDLFRTPRSAHFSFNPHDAFAADSASVEEQDALSIFDQSAVQPAQQFVFDPDLSNTFSSDALRFC